MKSIKYYYLLLILPITMGIILFSFTTWDSFLIHQIRKAHNLNNHKHYSKALKIIDQTIPSLYALNNSTLNLYKTHTLIQIAIYDKIISLRGLHNNLEANNEIRKLRSLGCPFSNFR